MPTIAQTTPPRSDLLQLLEVFQNGDFQKSEKLARSLTTRFVNDPVSWKVLSASLKHNGNLDSSIKAAKKALVLAPDDAETHCNLGAVLKDKGLFIEALKA